MNKQNKSQSTLIEKMGFKDLDIKESMHDKICLWLANKENVIKVLTNVDPELLPRVTPRFECAHNNGYRYSIHKEASEIEKQKCFDEFKEIYFKLIPIQRLPKSRWIHLEFERAINRERFIIGFIDLTITFKTDYTGYEAAKGLQIDLNHNIINIEVKSKMPGFGEILREINYYKQFTKSNIFIVIAPECSYEKELKEQGVYFYKFKQEDEPCQQQSQMKL